MLCAVCQRCQILTGNKGEPTAHRVPGDNEINPKSNRSVQSSLTTDDKNRINKRADFLGYTNTCYSHKR